VAPSEPQSRVDAVEPVEKVDASSGSVAAIVQLAIVSVALSYLVKYGGAMVPITSEAPWWAAAGLIVSAPALNANKWRERSAAGGDFGGFL